MDILMLRFDIFEKLHADLYDFWKNIINSIDDVNDFSWTFINEDIMSQRISPELYGLAESHFHLTGTHEDIKEELSVIYDKLKGYMVYPDRSKEEEILKDELHEIEESKKLILHDIKKLEYVIKKEMKKFWNHIDTLIINSYKQTLYDVTGSDDLVKSFMSELRVLRIMESLFWARRHNDYESISNMITMLDNSICNRISELEQLVMRNTT